MSQACMNVVLAGKSSCIYRRQKERLASGIRIAYASRVGNEETQILCDKKVLLPI